MPAPNPIKVNACLIANPDSEILAAQGYMPVVTSDRPISEKYYYIPIYIVDNGCIVQQWDEIEQQPVETLEDRLSAVEETAEVTAIAVEELIDIVTGGEE